MYFPILRGRQFELLALRDCVEKGILSDKVIPIVEPVKLSSTYLKTVDSFIKANRRVAIVRNPQVGVWSRDFAKESDTEIREKIGGQFQAANVNSAFYVTPKLEFELKEIATEINTSILLCNKPEYISVYETLFGNNAPWYSVIPDKSDFRRRIRGNRIMCEDHFPKQVRNVDYLNKEDEFFSSDHLYYEEDGYKGFSDYSVVGEEYSETGFAPYAVAIHIVYFDEKNILRIAHFVSDSNDDISDPARKFAEAITKMVEWNKRRGLDTVGIQMFEEAYQKEVYPGLGVVKKYSIMHHLEVMGRYLDEVQK